MWESRSDFQGPWEARGKPGFGFPALSTSPSFPRPSPGWLGGALGDTGEELSLGLAHLHRGICIRHLRGQLLELAYCQVPTERSDHFRQLSKNLPRRCVPAIDAFGFSVVRGSALG